MPEMPVPMIAMFKRFVTVMQVLGGVAGTIRYRQAVHYHGYAPPGASDDRVDPAPTNSRNESMITLIVLALLSLPLAMAVAWFVQKRVNNAGWVDVFWTFAIGIAGVSLSLWPLGGLTISPRQWLVGGLVALWAVRLGAHLAVRVAGGPEDVRYAAFRTQWGRRFQTRMFWFLQIQAAAAILLVISILAAARNPAPGLRVQDWLGVAVLAVAIFGEGIADAQLRAFKKRHSGRGHICDTGLWAWSRHPNYFFEWFGWLAYPLLAIDFSGGYGWGYVALSAPVFMYWLLAHVSGVPPLEAEMLKSRGAAFKTYQARTSAFFPLPPRTGSSKQMSHS
jgi:steroid 5-alpha reductase family enzyme